MAVRDSRLPLPAAVSSEVTLVDDPYRMAKGATALVLLTEWPEFGELDWDRIADLLEGHVVVDTRNHLIPEVVRRAGIAYVGAGKNAG